MQRAVEQLVWRRAHSCCEYCQMPQMSDAITFQIDHVIAACHGGATQTSNLALACFNCNNFKGPNLAGVDPVTRKVVRLFNPRRHTWARHFRWHGPILVGRTPIGRATVATLKINLDNRIAHRQALLDEVDSPPF